MISWTSPDHAGRPLPDTTKATINTCAVMPATFTDYPRILRNGPKMGSGTGRRPAIGSTLTGAGVSKRHGAEHSGAGECGTKRSAWLTSAHIMELIETLQRALETQYEVEAELEPGGMSRVFVARDVALNRRVVIKVLSPDLTPTVSANRFKREIMLAAQLQHPHIVAVLTAGELDGMPFYIMPFIEGDSLRNRLRLMGKLSVREVIAITKDVARALVYAHDRGIVHRDIKPDNILLSSGAAMLTDFGVAKALESAVHTTSGESETLTAVGISLGTPAYMAPEQVAADETTDGRADIYALGITAYEMLVGRPPFQHASRGALLTAHLTETPVHLRDLRPDAPAWFGELVMQCLEKDPAHRPQSADDLVDILEDPARTSGGGTAAVPIVKRRRRWRAVAGVGGVLLLLAAGASLPTLMGRKADDGATSIAVLPFVNVSGAPDDEYFADGLTDELITALNRIPSLRVASRTAVFAVKGSNKGVAELGKALNVGTLLEGTIRRGGDRLRLTARLVNVDDGLTLWSETFEHEVSDVFAVQDEVSESISSALAEQFSLENGATLSIRRGTENREAYDLYLRGRYFFERRGDEALRTALDYYQQAVQRDTTYADAYAGIADVLGLLPLYGGVPGDSVLPLALAAAGRAITLDSTLAHAHAARGNLLNAAWQWEDAARDLQHAVSLDPRDATAHQWYGENLLYTGRVEEAVAELEQAEGLDPLSPVVTALHAMALAIAGQGDDALARARRATDMDETLAVARLMSGAVFLYTGHAEESIPDFEAAQRLVPFLASPKGFLGYALAVTGKHDEARRVLATLDPTALDTGTGGAIARIYLGLGDLDSALAWLNRAAEARDPLFSSESLASPLYDPLRGRPGFNQVLDAVGLPRELLNQTRAQ
jgi:eukaryotic-like serine/threonine-protein kinase